MFHPSVCYLAWWLRKVQCNRHAGFRGRFSPTFQESPTTITNDWWEALWWGVQRLSLSCDTQQITLWWKRRWEPPLGTYRSWFITRMQHIKSRMSFFASLTYLDSCFSLKIDQDFAMVGEEVAGRFLAKMAFILQAESKKARIFLQTLMVLFAHFAHKCTSVGYCSSSSS